MNTTEIQSIKQKFGIIGQSPLLNHAIQVAAMVAATDLTVLISGESGTGKDVFSKIIHSLSTRKHGQFIAINCGAIPEGTIDAELFGHEKGAFTGAIDARKGYFEVTDNGTIFLDEIGEMPLGTQARLLRVLENKEFIRVGSSKVLKTDVRVIAATNVNLLQAVERKRFREDLYYRLNTVPLYVPALRERGDDIGLLFRKFASDFAEKYRVRPVRLAADANKILINYRFPGNIRQLKNLTDQISVLQSEQEINAQDLLGYLPATASQSLLPMAAADMQEANEKGYSERDLLYKVLFDMKKDVNELKKMVFDLAQGRTGSDSLRQHAALFENLESVIDTEQNAILPVKQLNYKENSDFNIEHLSAQNHHNPNNNRSSNPVELDNSEYNQEPNLDQTEDISHEAADESLSLIDKEREMIVKSLRRNSNKRKDAAKDLGISERTLYRKLKQYGLD